MNMSGKYEREIGIFLLNRLVIIIHCGHFFYGVQTRISRMFAHVPNPGIMSPKFLLASTPSTIVSMIFAPRIHTYFFL